MNSNRFKPNESSAPTLDDIPVYPELLPAIRADKQKVFLSKDDEKGTLLAQLSVRDYMSGTGQVRQKWTKQKITFSDLKDYDFDEEYDFKNKSKV